MTAQTPEQSAFVGARLPPDLVSFIDAIARRDGHGNRSAAMRKILVAVMDASGGDVPSLPGSSAAKYDGRSAAAKRHERNRRMAADGAAKGGA